MFDNGVLNLLKKLSDNGYEAYLVGGVVRDYLLGLECHDYDATTNATPAEIKQIYKDHQIFSYGEKYGTIGINYEGNLIE
ncbi:MAG: CCA tRNA nucleotidyltransferase, partial [Bacilli bacterium]|nr:CCA tRNA nucleotidyltransferase [Bacilli bacterium]